MTSEPELSPPDQAILAALAAITEATMLTLIAELSAERAILHAREGQHLKRDAQRARQTADAAAARAGMPTMPHARTGRWSRLRELLTERTAP